MGLWHCAETVVVGRMNTSCAVSWLRSINCSPYSAVWQSVDASDHGKLEGCVFRFVCRAWGKPIRATSEEARHPGSTCPKYQQLSLACVTFTSMKHENDLCLRCGSHSVLHINIFPDIVERCESLGLLYGVPDQLQTKTSHVIYRAAH